MKSSTGSSAALPAPTRAPPIFGNTSFGTCPPKFAITKSFIRFPAPSIGPPPVPTLFENVTVAVEPLVKIAAPVEAYSALFAAVTVPAAPRIESAAPFE